MKLVKILPVFAVIAATGMVPAGCDSLTGAGGDTAAFTEAAGTVLNSADSGSAVTKKIKVKFEVLNGGVGLWKSAGIVSTQDDQHLVYGENVSSRDYTIKITVPESDQYLNVRWFGDSLYSIFTKDTYVKAKMKPESGTITLDYNGKGKVAVKNLYDVLVNTYSKDWDDTKKRAGK